MPLPSSTSGHVLKRFRIQIFVWSALLFASGLVNGQSVLGSANQLASLPTDVSPELIDAALKSGFNPGSLPSNLLGAPGFDAAGLAFEVPSQLYLDAPIVYGALSIRPKFSYQSTYSDGLPTAPGLSSESWIDSYSGGLLATYGERFVFDYTVSQSYYSAAEFEDSLDHNLSFIGSFQVGEVPLTFTQRYATDSTPQLESGRQIRQETVDTSLAGSYRLSDAWSLTASGLQSLRFIEADEDQYTWTGNAGTNYQLTNRMNVGLAVRTGYIAIDKIADTFFWGPQAQFGWQPGEKLSLSATVGSQERYTYDDVTPKTVDGTFNLGAGWTPFEFTSISLNGGQDLQPSISGTETLFNRSWGAGISQRFLQRFFGSANYAWRETSYRPGPNSPSPTAREDITEIVSVSLSTTVLRRLSLSLSFQYTFNDSADPTFDYEAKSASASVSYSF